MAQELFFVIEVTKKSDNSRGFIIERPDGIHVSSEPTAEMRQFDSYYEARQFIKKHHLERGAKASILSNVQIIESMKEYKTLSKAPVVYYYVINDIGQKLFFDTLEDGYYFKEGDVGYCVWQDEDAVKEFVKVMEFPPDVTHKRVVQNLTTEQKN